MLGVKRQQRPSRNVRGALRKHTREAFSMAQARIGAISQFSYGITVVSNTILIRFFTSSSRESRSRLQRGAAIGG
jgi:hypothetical protein